MKPICAERYGAYSLDIGQNTTIPNQFSYYEPALLGRLSVFSRQRDDIRVGGREIDERGHTGRMLVAGVAVNFQGQCAAVLVAKAAGGGRHVNAALLAAGGEYFLCQINRGSVAPE